MLETVLISVVLPILTGLAGWWGGKAMREQEVKSKELENSEKIIAMWREAAQFLEKNNGELKVNNTQLVEKLDTLTREYEQVLKDNRELKQTIEALRKRIAKLEQAVQPEDKQ